MRLRRSTVVLLVVFVATLVCYVLVRPANGTVPREQPAPPRTSVPVSTAGVRAAAGTPPGRR